MPKVPPTKNSKVITPSAIPSTSDNYIFFWKPDEKDYGWASQWYPSSFTLQIEFPRLPARNESDSPAAVPHEISKPTSTSPSRSDTESKECTFPTAEHYMMFRKALLFGDTSIAELILSPSCSGTSKSDLAHVKALGRQVQNFDERTWQANRYQIVLDGNLAKFRQNPEIKEKLFNTGSRKHVEASPRDRIWGIGFGKASAAKMVNTMSPQGKEPEKWGLNLLGKALDETRKVLQEEGSKQHSC